MKKTRFRNFTGTIYKDSTTYDFVKVILAGQDYFDEFSYIEHDKDIDEETGQVKKLHIHWVGRLKNPRELKTISNKLGLADHDIEIVNSYKGIIRYLIHADNEEKYQYNFSDIKTTIPDIKQYFLQFSTDEALHELIEMNAQGLSRLEMYYKCRELGLISAYVRYYKFISYIYYEDKN